MKKLILIILSGLFSLMMYSQTYDVYISGLIKDDITNLPITNHEIIISIDSLEGGFMYFNSITTNDMGYFEDIIQVRTGLEGTVQVSTVSCDTTIIQSDFFSMNITQLSFDFIICFYQNGNDCDAFFSYYNTEQPLGIQFIDLSIGLLTNWLWDFGDGTFSNEQNPLHVYSEGGQYNASLVIEADNCTSQFELFVIVENDTLPNCEAYFSNNVGTTPLTIEFFDTSLGNVVDWDWEFGDGTYSNEPNPIHTFDEEGTYPVSLFIRTSDSCFSYYEDFVTVYNDTTLCNAAFNVSLDTINNIPHTYIFTDLSEGEIYSWNWDFGDGSFSNEQNPIHVYTDGGIYNTCLTIVSLSGDHTCSSTECKEITTTKYYNFGGQVFIGAYPINIDSGDMANIAVANLYRKVNNSWLYMDSREFWEYGYYWFVNKPVGQYLIVTELTENSVDYDDYAPAYYPNAISWKNASTFILSNNQQFAVNISLRELVTSTSGIGSISGMIIGGASCDTNYNIDTDHVLVQLFNSSRQLISYTFSDAEGNYEFTGLDMNNYYIVPEYTGKYTEETNITISDTEPSLNEINLIINCSHPLNIDEVTSNYIASIEEIYPNPVYENAELKINIKKGSAIVINILNQFGQIVFESKAYLSRGNHIVKLPTSSFAQGMYFIKITPEDNISTVRKLIKSK